MLLDYSLTTSDQRIEYVNDLLSSYSPNTNELSLLTDYILFTRDKNQTKKEKISEYSITTPNRESTISKRQISYEGLIEKLENGEDGIYSLLAEGKEIKLDNKKPISQSDIDNIPGIKESLDTIELLEKQYKKATGIKRKQIKTSIIETWKQIYAIKKSYQTSPSIITTKLKTTPYSSIPEDIYFDENDIPQSNASLSLLNQEHVNFILQNYQYLKQESISNIESDMRWFLIDLEDLASAALKNYPILKDIFIWKIQKLTNKEIKEKVLKKYNENHSEQYYSSVWRKRIPKLITEEAQKRILLQYCRAHNIGYWKRCSKCGRLLLGHPLFFHKNSSKDKYYSQCKECKGKS